MQVVLKFKIIGAQLLHDSFLDPASNPVDFFLHVLISGWTRRQPGTERLHCRKCISPEPYPTAIYGRIGGECDDERRAFDTNETELTQCEYASTIHIGATIGVGYLATTQRQAEFAAS